MGTEKRSIRERGESRYVTECFTRAVKEQSDIKVTRRVEV